jgi:fermentation-respiration switch protein FrsA (DUF1100 family)
MIVQERVMAGDIPCLRIYSQGDAPTGIVVFYHGWTSTKELQSVRGHFLASYGYAVLIPEAINHGERGVINYDDGDRSYVAFWQTILQNVREAPVIEAYCRCWLPQAPLAVMGHSMGAFTTMGVMTHYPAFQTAVAMNGSGWWDESDRRFRSSLQIDPFVGLSELQAEIKQWDPYSHMEHLRGRSLLAMNGGADPVVDNMAQTLYMEQLARHNDVSQAFMTYPKLAHFVTTNMMGDAIAWLDEKLGIH